MAHATAPTSPAIRPHSRSALARWLGPIGLALLLVVLVGAIASLGRVEGGPGMRMATVAAAYWTLLVAGPIGAAYLLAAIGLGRLARPLCAGSAHALWIQGAVGVGLMLWLSHLLGVLGLLSGRAGPYVAIGALLVGLALLADQVVRGELRPEKWPVVPGWIMLAAPGTALMLVAACSPPGWLWESEKGGFDVRSYHLQLAREWVEGTGGQRGRIWPLDHNVYSYLPGYVEAAYTHIGAMMRVADHSVRAAPALIGGSGVGVYACQLLHAGLGLLTGALIGRIVHTLLTRAPSAAAGAPTDPRRAVLASFVAGATAISIPWTIVVGSMAYNELAVTALGAGALLAAIDSGRSPWRRGALAGLLVALACAAKPTAAILVAPWAASALLGLMPPGRWPGAILAGLAAGAAASAPWLIRNALACGNPVFPFATGLLGHGRWTAPQVERYAAAHHAPGGADLPGLLFSSDRGILHDQWSMVFPAAAIALVLVLSRRSTRGAGALLGGGALVSMGAWLLLTHVQSRFLVPLVVPMSVLIGLAVAGVLELAAAMGASAAMRGALAAVCAAVPVPLAWQAGSIFAVQHDSRPNGLLAGGVAQMTGAAYEEDFAEATDSERDTMLAEAPTPEVYVNLGIEASQTIYLLGDSTPLYFRAPVLYHTTWDRSPLGEAIREHPGDPAAWGVALRGRGITYILVNGSELHRLGEVDHWYDPVVTPAAVESLVRQECEAVRAWQERGQILVRLRPAKGGAP